MAVKEQSLTSVLARLKTTVLLEALEINRWSLLSKQDSGGFSFIATELPCVGMNLPSEERSRLADEKTQMRRG